MGRLVALTGASGFLGQHLIAALLGAGYSLRVLARRPLDHPGVEAVAGSLEDPDALARLVRGAAAVVHAAGLIKAGSAAEFRRVNAGGTAALAAAVLAHAAQARFVLVSSLAAREPGLSAYAASKRLAEAAAAQAFAGTPQRLVILRPPAVYGPGDKATLALFRAARLPLVPCPRIGRAAVVHAEDAAGAIAALIDDGRPGVFALGGDRPQGYRLPELLAAAARATGGAPRLLPLPDTALQAAAGFSALWGRLRGQPALLTPGKARELLHQDWSVSERELLPGAIHQPRIGLGPGFAGTVAWYRQAGWLDRPRDPRA